VQLEVADDLLAAAAEALARQVDSALRRGVLQGYLTVEEALPTVRGRIREAEQLRRRFATPLPVEIRYDDYTIDIAENRILRAAVERMLALLGVSERARHRLSRARARLIEASPLVPGAPLPPWTPTRLNARYTPALRLAELVLAATSWEHAHGDVPVTKFLVNMATVFESFVCTALGEEIAARGGLARTQDTSRTLDDDGAVDLRPDLVWYSPDMRPVAVVDAKYKAERYDGFPNADIYQLLAYCTAFGLARGHLAYAKGNEEARTYTISAAGVQVVAHCLDLEAAPAELLGQVAELAAAVGPESEGRAP
jgi:5-methylcytosine-specific restriction enzyme subunit McrC